MHRSLQFWLNDFSVLVLVLEPDGRYLEYENEYRFAEYAYDDEYEYEVR